MSSDNRNSSVAGSVGVSGLLQVAFIVLKLCGVIKWSWLWVLAPTWIPIAIWLVTLVVGLIFVLWKD